MDDRPIKAHLDEQMREYIAFLIRRRYNDITFVSSQGGKILYKDEELSLAEKCLKELMEAGT